jgi:hypothetical protein
MRRREFIEGLGAVASSSLSLGAARAQQPALPATPCEAEAT